MPLIFFVSAIVLHSLGHRQAAVDFLCAAVATWCLNMVLVCKSDI